MKIRASLLVTVLMVGLMPVLAAEPASATTVTARSMLFKLALKAESGSTTYSRTYFKQWVDANGDCQNTRAEVLVAESKVTPTFTTTTRCSVAKGKWYSYYDGATWTLASDVDIDHMVPLKEAWESGARVWSVTNRTRYANDISFAGSLVAVTDNVNQAKGDRDPAGWLPPRIAARCSYAIQWVQVKYRWRLSIDSAERSRLSSILSGSCGSRAVWVPPLVTTVVAPAPAPAPAPTPPPPPPAPSGVYYANCTDARAAGAAPLYIGQPGYRSALDRDGDGIACE